MAIARNNNQNPKCPKCGEGIKGIYRPQSLEPSNYFFGDNFQGWDWSGHVCDPNKLKPSVPVPDGWKCRCIHFDGSCHNCGKDIK